jgi:hypothetical protein
VIWPADKFPGRLLHFFELAGFSPTRLRQPPVELICQTESPGAPKRLWRRYEVINEGTGRPAPLRPKDSLKVHFIHASYEGGAVGILRTERLIPGPSTRCYGKYVNGIGWFGCVDTNIWDDRDGWNRKESSRQVAKLSAASKHQSGIIFEFIFWANHVRKSSSTAPEAIEDRSKGPVLATWNCSHYGTIMGAHEDDVKQIAAVWVDMEWGWD